MSRNSWILFATVLMLFVPSVWLLAEENEVVSPAESSRRVVFPKSNVTVLISNKGVSPEHLQVTPGATVIWLNKSSNPVRIRFTDNAVSTTCKAPRNFGIGAKGIYVSGNISQGDLASICFLEVQKYGYRVDLLSVDTEETSKREVQRTFLGEILVESAS